MISARPAVRVRDMLCTLPERPGDIQALKLTGGTRHIPLRAASKFERVVMARSRWKCA